MRFLSRSNILLGGTFGALLLLSWTSSRRNTSTSADLSRTSTSGSHRVICDSSSSKRRSWPRGNVSTWDDVRRLPSIFLNFGGGLNRHPRRHYTHYVAVEAEAEGFDWCRPPQPSCGDWCVCLAPAAPWPLADGTVSRISSEDCLERASCGISISTDLPPSPARRCEAPQSRNTD